MISVSVKFLVFFNICSLVGSLHAEPEKNHKSKPKQNSGKEEIVLSKDPTHCQNFQGKLEHQKFTWNNIVGEMSLHLIPEKKELSLWIEHPDLLANTASIPFKQIKINLHKDENGENKISIIYPESIQGNESHLCDNENVKQGVSVAETPCTAFRQRIARALNSLDEKSFSSSANKESILKTIRCAEEILLNMYKADKP